MDRAAPVRAIRPSRRLGLAVLGAVLAVGRPAAPAQFGVPNGTVAPAGYFILTGPNIPIFLDNFSWGDRRHAMDLYIEVTGNALRVDLYDPGLVSATPGNLDLFFNGTIGQVTYTLYDPAGAVVAQRAFQSDTEGPGGSNLALFTLYNGPAQPGVYRLNPTMDDTPGADEDINTFGVKVPAYDFYAYSFTGGEATGAGAVISEPLVVHPWIVHSTPAVFMGSPITGIDVLNLDMEAATAGVSPPNLRIQTPSARGADILPSQDNGLYTINLRGLDVAAMDCSDYGIFSLRASNLAQVREGSNDLNIYTAQIAKYGSGILPADFPVPRGDPAEPRRLYFPRDDGSTPLKESLVHLAAVVSGPDPPEVGTASVIEVTLRIANPSGYALSAIDVTTSLTADPQFGDPVVSAQSGGLSATVIGRDVHVTGGVAAGQTGTIQYRTTFTPAAVGTFYITGDGSDLNGGTRPTAGNYLTPFATAAAPERFGPICMLRTASVVSTCRVTARLTGDLDLCPGESTTLSASSSSLTQCSGVAEYRWLKDGLQVVGFPGTPTLTDSPTADSVYRVDVRCSSTPACMGSTQATVVVRPDVPPGPVGNSLVAVRFDDDVAFGWLPTGTPAYHLRRFPARDLDRAASTVLATRTVADYLAVGEARLVAPNPAFYQSLAVNDCGTEEPARPEPEDVEPSRRARVGCAAASTVAAPLPPCGIAPDGRDPVASQESGALAP